MSYEYVLYSFYEGDDYKISVDEVGSFDSREEADDSRSKLLEKNPSLNPQNVQVIQLVF